MERTGSCSGLEVHVTMDGEILNILFPELHFEISIEPHAFFLIFSHRIVKIQRGRVAA